MRHMVSHLEILEIDLIAANPCECRPCCPANFFLGSAIGTPSPPQTDAPACVLRLTGHGLRCLQRFHEKHGIDGMMFHCEARCCRCCGIPSFFFFKPLHQYVVYGILQYRYVFLFMPGSEGKKDIPTISSFRNSSLQRQRPFAHRKYLHQIQRQIVTWKYRTDLMSQKYIRNVMNTPLSAINLGDRR